MSAGLGIGELLRLVAADHLAARRYDRDLAGSSTHREYRIRIYGQVSSSRGAYESDRPAACAARGSAKLHAVATSSHEGSRLGRASIWQGMSGEGLPFSTRPPQSDAPNGSSVRVGFALLAHRTGTGIGNGHPVSPSDSAVSFTLHCKKVQLALDHISVEVYLVQRPERPV